MARKKQGGFGGPMGGGVPNQAALMRQIQKMQKRWKQPRLPWAKKRWK